MARLEYCAPRLPATGGLCPRRERIAKQLILANLGESLTIAELAQACALSRSHFSRAFKCSTGLSHHVLPEPHADQPGVRVLRPGALLPYVYPQ
jgi:AraC-like DNA-binding protein